MAMILRAVLLITLFLPAHRFYRLGEQAAARPYTFIFVPLVVCLACTAGFATIDVQHQPERLYTPQSSKAFDDKDYVEEVFGYPNRQVQLYATATSATGVLTKTALLALHDARDVVAGVCINYDGPHRADGEYCYPELCLATTNVGGDVVCQEHSVLVRGRWGWRHCTPQLTASTRAPHCRLCGTTRGRCWRRRRTSRPSSRPSTAG